LFKSEGCLLMLVKMMHIQGSIFFINFLFLIMNVISFIFKYTICSAQIEEFILPANDCTSPGIMELKGIPKSTSLVVGHHGFGRFSIWYVLLFFSLLPLPLFFSFSVVRQASDYRFFN
jgi:hypothetical protein